MHFNIYAIPYNLIILLNTDHKFVDDDWRGRGYQRSNVDHCSGICSRNMPFLDETDQYKRYIRVGKCRQNV